jgi:hypothetical protein
MFFLGLFCGLALAIAYFSNPSSNGKPEDVMMTKRLDEARLAQLMQAAAEAQGRAILTR